MTDTQTRTHKHRFVWPISTPLAGRAPSHHWRTSAMCASSSSSFISNSFFPIMGDISRVVSICDCSLDAIITGVIRLDRGSSKLHSYQFQAQLSSISSHRELHLHVVIYLLPSWHEPCVHSSVTNPELPKPVWGPFAQNPRMK